MAPLRVADLLVACIRSIFLVSICAFLGACAWTQESIDIPYQRAGEPVTLDRAGSVTVWVTDRDAREVYRDRVSSKKNSFGMEAAPIVAASDVLTTVQTAIEQELSARGFRIGPNSVVIDLALRRFYSDFKIGFFAGDAIADFDAEVTVLASDGRRIFTKSYFAQGKTPDIQLASGTNARTALVEALSRGVNRIVTDPELIEALFRASNPSVAFAH
jgi:uncharacterized lipoprotein